MQTVKDKVNALICTKYRHFLIIWLPFILSQTLYMLQCFHAICLIKQTNKQKSVAPPPLFLSSFLFSSHSFCVCNMEPIWDGQPLLSWWCFPPGHPIGRWTRSSLCLVRTQPFESSGTAEGTGASCNANMTPLNWLGVIILSHLKNENVEFLCVNTADALVGSHSCRPKVNSLTSNEDSYAYNLWKLLENGKCSILQTESLSGSCLKESLCSF